ncbi:hypothetical protein CU633_07345 [Bacillus sp. V3-13]|uniref:YrhC family protein n=1 Tax=Bacillus sp. V3-13 TaxID=2053728 RepID=UPI000C770CD7|nr:YrhC family protein [Bacillus sp. V3-13]PLR78066.1 hypothetical protein CU633_07345 [Bacillus sp. V3-13]
MKHSAKHVYEKMVDFKRFGTILLSVGAFFYLGAIIPSAANTIGDLYMMMAASTGFLAGSIFFFTVSKQYRSKLSEMDEGEEYLMKK